MKVLYVPVFRVPISYTVSYGRRWSILEHLLLVELAESRRSVAALAESASLPERLVVEALINLMRAGWIEVRSSDDVALFSATELGRKRAGESKLKAELKRRVRRTSLCMDRLTGSWLNGEGLDLVHERDLPMEADALPPVISALNTQNAEVRELLPLEDDEAFERLEANGRSPARFYVRVEVGLGGIKGFPSSVPWRLAELILGLEEVGEAAPAGPKPRAPSLSDNPHREDITAENLIVGGRQHRDYLRYALAQAKTHVIIHSCFMHPETLRDLLVDFETAAARKVRVELLWGLIVDPEDVTSRQSVTDCHKVLESLSPRGRSRVTISPTTSLSHLKAIVADCGPDGTWETVVGSCNFLSSWFELTELSVRSRNPRVTAQVLGYLTDAQIPASGGWSPLVVRLNRSWNTLRRRAKTHVEAGTHGLRLVLDRDHHACIRHARDSSASSIVVASDLFGMAAETSVLVPMERASELGKTITLLYRRPSKTLVEQSGAPDQDALAKRGLTLRITADLHAKFLVWGEEGLAVTSFNWLSTAVGARSHGTELGVMIEGPGLRQALAEQFRSVDPLIHQSLKAEGQGVLPLVEARD